MDHPSKDWAGQEIVDVDGNPGFLVIAADHLLILVMFFQIYFFCLVSFELFGGKAQEIWRSSSLNLRDLSLWTCCDPTSHDFWWQASYILTEHG